MRRYVLLALLVAVLVAAAPVVYAAPKISGYTEKIVVNKVGKYMDVSVTSSFTITGISSDQLYIPILAHYYTKKKPIKLESCSVKVGGEELVVNASVVKLGDAYYVVAKLSKPIGSASAQVTVTTSGVIKSTAKLYVTPEYKYYKDYSKAKYKVLYYDLVNTWSYKLGKPVKIIVISPKGWRILAARSSLSPKTRYMEMKVYNYPDYSSVEFTYLDTKKMTPKDLSPGCDFPVEVYFIQVEDYTNPAALAWGILLLAVAGLSCYAYRDVYKYVTRKISVTMGTK